MMYADIKSISFEQIDTVTKQQQQDVLGHGPLACKCPAIIFICIYLLKKDTFDINDTV